MRTPVEVGKAEVLKKGSDVLLFALGSMVETAWNVSALLEKKGISCSVVNARFAKPFDEELLREMLPEHRLLVTMEENILSGGFGEHVEAWVLENHAAKDVLRIGIPDRFIEHGSCDRLKKELGIDTEGVYSRILEALGSTGGTYETEN